MDAHVLARAMGNTVSMARYEQLAPAFNAAMIQAGCITVDRAAMWCAQIGHESGGLQWMEELADGADYEWRQDLGNTQSGDGRRFKGHGPIQITGRYNHTKVSEWAHSKGYVPTPTYFVDNPAELAGDRYGFLGAVWYWTVARDMNSYADRGDIDGATRAVNGGTNGLTDRQLRWDRCRSIGPALLPTQGASMTDVPVLALDQLAGPGWQGWEILGRSKVDPSRYNTLVEAVAEIRDALCVPKASLVEGSTFVADHETFGRLTDAATYRTELAVEQLTMAVVALSATVTQIAAKMEGK